MNKAFVREPEFDGRTFCPRCGSQGVPVGPGPLDTHLQPAARARFAESGYYCAFARCDVVFFTALERIATVQELQRPAYPYDLDAPICACFGLTYDDVQADVDEGSPRRIREIVRRAATPEAHCAKCALDGQCCLAEVQKLYIRLRGGV